MTGPLEVQEIPRPDQLLPYEKVLTVIAEVFRVRDFAQTWTRGGQLRLAGTSRDGYSVDMVVDADGDGVVELIKELAGKTTRERHSAPGPTAPAHAVAMLYTVFDVLGPEKIGVTRSVNEDGIAVGYAVRCRLDGKVHNGEGPTLGVAALNFFIELGEVLWTLDVQS